MTNKEKYKQAFSVLQTSDDFAMEVQIWVHGDQTDAVMEIDPDSEYSSYTLSYTDENGEEVERSGGGIAMDEDGNERPLTQEELLEELNMPEVEYLDDGSVWVYYYNQKLEITDKFDEDGICYIQVSKGGEVLYLTIKYQGGYSCSRDRYASPSVFD